MKQFTYVNISWYFNQLMDLFANHLFSHNLSWYLGSGKQEIFEQSDLDFLISDEWDLYDEETSVRGGKILGKSEMVLGETVKVYEEDTPRI